MQKLSIYLQKKPVFIKFSSFKKAPIKITHYDLGIRRENNKIIWSNLVNILQLYRYQL